MQGYIIGLLELLFYFIGSYSLRRLSTRLQQINKATYYWVMMTILTGIWEISYLSNYYKVVDMSQDLIINNEHVWTKTGYDFSYILPWKLSQMFYSEYGAWADREYMSNTDDWSRVIEGSHCTQCALFSLLAIIFKLYSNNNNYLIALSASMGTQFMNSFLYMYSYFIQEKDPNSVNYDDSNFPSGTLLDKRLFMWVNIFWLIMPFYTIAYYLIINIINYRKKIKELEEAMAIEFSKLPDDVKLL